MYENWEFRPGDIDLVACEERRILVGGTNERHPNLRVFDYLGMLAAYGLLHCRIPVANSRVLLISDNPFCPYIARTLIGCGARIDIVTSDASCLQGTDLIARPLDAPGEYDAVVVADTPRGSPAIGGRDGCKYRVEELGTFPVLVQIWGDVDHTSLKGVECYPKEPPETGHMGILLNVLGADPIIRLQAGGLKVGELLARYVAGLGTNAERGFKDSEGYAESLAGRA
jgi:hypothetical protein